MKQSPLSFRKLAERLDEFDAERKWLDLDPEDLAKSIVLEGAELLEHFQWDNTLRNRKDIIPHKDREAIKSEVADILVYLLKFCREMKIDLVPAVLEKLEKLEKKYPVNYNKSARGLNHEEYLRIKRSYRLKK